MHVFFNPEQMMLLVKPEGLDQEHDALIKTSYVYTAVVEALCNDWITKDYMNESNTKNSDDMSFIYAIKVLIRSDYRVHPPKEQSFNRS